MILNCVIVLKCGSLTQLLKSYSSILSNIIINLLVNLLTLRFIGIGWQLLMSSQRKIGIMRIHQSGPWIIHLSLPISSGFLLNLHNLSTEICWRWVISTIQSSPVLPIKELQSLFQISYFSMLSTGISNSLIPKDMWKWLTMALSKWNNSFSTIWTLDCSFLIIFIFSIIHSSMGLW